MKLRRPRQIVLALAVCLAACDSGTQVPTSQTPGGSAKSVADSRQPLDVVADGILAALARPAVRAQMIALLRSSPWVEHKVSLVDAMEASGGSLRRESAAALSLSENDFGSLVAALPAMDFYVADREQRRSWRGEGDVRLAVSSDGKTFVTRGGSENAALFALQPAEPKGYRIGRQAQTAGAVIEDQGDGGGGLNIDFVNQNGQAVSIDVGASGMTMDQLKDYLVAQGAPITKAEGGPARSGTLFTAVEYVYNVMITDEVGSSEIEWKAWKYISGSGSAEYDLRWTGVWPGDILITNGSCGSYSGCIPYALQMWSWVPAAGQSVRGEMWETDTGSDDHYGTLYWTGAEMGTTKTFWGGPEYCFNGSSQFSCADARVNTY